MEQKYQLDLTRDPRKFDKHEQVLPYYGSTIICLMNSLDWPIGALVNEFQHSIKAASYSGKLALLPLTSIHMTVISLLREIDRGQAVWPADIDPAAPFTAIDQLLLAKYQQVPKFSGVEMVIDAVTTTKLHLKAANAAHEQALRDYRDHIAEVTGIRHPGHDDYQFHVTMAYVCQDFSAAEAAEAAALSEKLTQMARERLTVFRLPEPRFMIFNDMLSYSTDLADRKQLC